MGWQQTSIPNLQRGDMAANDTMTKRSQGREPTLYRSILLALDGSPCSAIAQSLALALGQQLEARVVGIHVYAARMHEVRFQQMEPGLPDRYQEDQELDRLRGTHHMIIGGGMKLISDAYMEEFERQAQGSGLDYATHTPEGHHYVELLKELSEGEHDLVVLGALGLGKIQRSLIGGVAERVLRRSPCDVLLARKEGPLRGGRILVAVDGSRDALAAVRRAARLSHGLAATLEAVAVYDPFFHGGVFGTISGVLSEEAAQRFDFRAQEQLHDEIIDQGLEKIYGDYLKQAALLAEQEGVSVQTRLLAGKSFACILDRAAESDSALVVVGRHGSHREEMSQIGSTSENVARLAATNVLVVAASTDGTAAPELPVEQEAKPLPWDSDAEARLRRVPRMARRMARRAIEAYAREHGHSRVSLDVYRQARRGFGMGG